MFPKHCANDFNMPCLLTSNSRELFNVYLIIFRLTSCPRHILYSYYLVDSNLSWYWPSGSPSQFLFLTWFPCPVLNTPRICIIILIGKTSQMLTTCQWELCSLFNLSSMHFSPKPHEPKKLTKWSLLKLPRGRTQENRRREWWGVPIIGC